MCASGTVQAPESTKPTKVCRWLSRATALVYGLVMFEVVIMVSPFAFYFYAAYGPTLKWLNHSAATAWLTGFMLPHAVFTTSPFLEFLRWDLGRYFFGLGLLGFFVLAAQIYGSKLFRRKVVSSGVYRCIRHPQYLCLGLSAFRSLHNVAAHDYLPLVGGDAVYLLLSSAGGGATHAGDRFQLCRLFAPHRHVPAWQPWGPSLPTFIWKSARPEIGSPARVDELARAGFAAGIRPARLYCAAYRSHRGVAERGSRLGLPYGSHDDATTILFGSVRSLSSAGLAARGERYLCRPSSATRLWDDREVCRCWHWSHGAWEYSLVTLQVSVRMASAISRFPHAH